MLRNALLRCQMAPALKGGISREAAADIWLLRYEGTDKHAERTTLTIGEVCTGGHRLSVSVGCKLPLGRKTGCIYT
jgi:hypothetical protein